jgi:hypothetical protein
MGLDYRRDRMCGLRLAPEFGGQLPKSSPTPGPWAAPEHSESLLLSTSAIGKESWVVIYTIVRMGSIMVTFLGQ